MAGDRYPRAKGGQFGKGNPGKPVGAKHWANRKIAEIAREYLDEGGDDAIKHLMDPKKVPPEVLLNTLRFLTDRADGKAPMTIRHGMDPDSPEGLLLALAGQALPGQTSGSGSDST